MDPAPSASPPPPAASAGPRLFLVATPIGHRGDLSPRAVEALRQSAWVACEDTRTTGQLLAWLGISKRLVACHEHNETRLASTLADAVAAGETGALVSEAGTPAISDPGFRVVREFRRRGLIVEPVPGPCAAVVALSASGLPTDSFLYLGFAPPNSARRRRLFEEHRDLPCTLVFYESTHRVESCLDDLLATLGPDRCVAVARELTKIHETFTVGRLEDVRTRVLAASRKGEFVILVAKRDYQL